MSRYKLTIEYNGTNFSGWQIQPDARTVEGVLEAAFSKILQRPIDLLGQGRTDAGVHAKAQTAHVDLELQNIELDRLIFGVNGIIGKEIYIHSAEKVHDDFHARFDALSREYTYTILKKRSPLLSHLGWEAPREFDSSSMYKCAELLIGEFDFAGFSKYNEENYTSLCTILNCSINETENSLEFTIEANRFLRNMVRRIIGTMMQVSIGKISVSDFEELLNNPISNTKTFTAPAHGLTLKKIIY